MYLKGSDIGHTSPTSGCKRMDGFDGEQCESIWVGRRSLPRVGCPGQWNQGLTPVPWRIHSDPMQQERPDAQLTQWAVRVSSVPVGRFLRENLSLRLACRCRIFVLSNDSNVGGSSFFETFLRLQREATTTCIVGVRFLFLV